MTLFSPVGVVAAITPFNAPVNQLMHKVPAAIAAGCPVVFKPSELTPACAAEIVAILEESGLEPGFLNLVHGDHAIGSAMTGDPRTAAIPFTGSVAAGRAIQAAAGLRPTVLELGNSSPNVVHADADLELAASAIVKGGFSYSGQLCVSVQRMLVAAEVIDEFVPILAEKARALEVGDPMAESTDVGPMISEAAAERAERTVAAAVERGAELVCGGGRDSSLMQPTVLLRPHADDPVVCDEVFAPIVGVQPYDGIAEAIELANSTPFGLSAGVFTDSTDVAFALARGIDAGTVNVNDASTVRADVSPFAGLKDSGVGREGIRYAIRQFLDEKLVAFALRPAEQAKR